MGQVAQAVRRIGRLRRVKCSWANADFLSEEEEDEDETAELLRELEKIKRERAEQRAQQVGSVRPTIVKLLLKTDLGARESRRGAGKTRERHCPWQSIVECFKER